MAQERTRRPKLTAVVYRRMAANPARRIPFVLAERI